MASDQMVGRTLLFPPILVPAFPLTSFAIGHVSSLLPPYIANCPRHRSYTQGFKESAELSPTGLGTESAPGSAPERVMQATGLQLPSPDLWIASSRVVFGRIVEESSIIRGGLRLPQAEHHDKSSSLKFTRLDPRLSPLILLCRRRR
ncbi:hypothetical protein B0H12DRAFT_1077982 [Mycena haematopus]|nr:hypothetical protein B0H12DRAFT_1077982 [Mycena haematopus]